MEENKTIQSSPLNFHELSKKGKKIFLANDLIERMIRVEQRVCAHFGESVPYNKTEYYKSLTDEERRSFEKYMKNKNFKKRCLAILILIPCLILILGQISFTGNVVQSSFETFFGFNYLFVFLLILAIFFSVDFWWNNRKRKERFRHHFNVLDEVIHKKVFK